MMKTISFFWGREERKSARIPSGKMDHLRFYFPSFCLLPSFLNDNAYGSWQTCSITIVTLSFLLPRHCCCHFADCLDDVDSILWLPENYLFQHKTNSLILSSILSLLVSDGFGNCVSRLLIAFTCRLGKFFFFISLPARLTSATSI